MDSISHPLGRLWLLTGLPFLLLPVVFISDLVVPAEALWNHAAFHLVYLPVIALATLTLWRLQGATRSPLLRALLLLMLLAQVAALVGHVGELAVTAAEGFLTAPASVFEDERHVFFADFAVFGLMAGVVLLLVLTAVVGVQRLRDRRARRRATAEDDREPASA